MFNLEQSIVEWRKEMLAAGIKSPVPLQELESHLREEIELQILAGSDAPFAFDAAVRQIGKATFIKTEFAKIQQQSNMKTMRKILASATALIAIFGVGLAGLFVWEQWPVLAHRPTQFTIAVTGQSGLPFTGDIKVDGSVMSVSGVTPTNYVVIGRSVDCRLQKQQVGGPLGVCLRMRYLNGTCSVTTPESGTGVGASLSLHNGSCYTF
jgi:hypothetical protein